MIVLIHSLLVAKGLSAHPSLEQVANLQLSNIAISLTQSSCPLYLLFAILFSHKVTDLSEAVRYWFSDTNANPQTAELCLRVKRALFPFHTIAVLTEVKVNTEMYVKKNPGAPYITLGTQNLLIPGSRKDVPVFSSYQRTYIMCMPLQNNWRCFVIIYLVNVYLITRSSWCKKSCEY